MNDALPFDPSVDVTVQARFARVVAQWPEQVALASDELSLTYAELDARSDAVAAVLCDAGVEPGAYVALLMERSAEALIAVIGVLKAGAAYLPIDGSWPAERVLFALRDADVAAVIADTPSEVVGVEVPVFGMGEFVAASSSHRAQARSYTGDGQDLAYAMYTSGSTGTPKGVEIRHRSILRLVLKLSLIHISEPTRPSHISRMPSSA